MRKGRIEGGRADQDVDIGEERTPRHAGTLPSVEQLEIPGGIHRQPGGGGECEAAAAGGELAGTRLAFPTGRSRRGDQGEQGQVVTEIDALIHVGHRLGHLGAGGGEHRRQLFETALHL